MGNNSTLNSATPNPCFCGHDYAQHAGSGSWTLAGSVGAGRALSVTIAGTVVNYNTVAGDTTLAIMAASLAAAIMAQANFVTAWAVGAVVKWQQLPNLANPNALYTSNGGAGGTTITPSSNTAGVDACTFCSDAHAFGNDPTVYGTAATLQRTG